MSKNTLLKGTAILTIAGLLTRVLGFFYRIFLSNAMDTDKIGIYQLIFPIYSICFTIYASGIQTSISKLVAAEYGKKQYKNVKRILRIGLFLSVSSALVLSVLVYYFSDFLAVNYLREASAASPLRLLAIVFPFCGITACINGYYYGLKKTGVPASTQLLEQIVRVIFIYVLVTVIGKNDIKLSTELAVLGLVIGEIVSNLYNIASMFISSTPKEVARLASETNTPPSRKRNLISQMLHMVFPLTGNRLLISILHSVEAILIPTMLKKFGLSSSEALSIYGILNGMTFPFIMFPSAVTNSLSVLLLPTISEAVSTSNYVMIKKTTTIAIKYTLLIGILSTGIFIGFGEALGMVVFHNQIAGNLLVTLAWLCPLIYLTTTLGSIINGLGLAHLTFINSIVGLLVRILLILYLIPKNGITGYLISLLISQLVITFFDGYVIMKHIRPKFEAVDFILKPGLIIALLTYILSKLYDYIKTANGGIIPLLFFCGITAVVYLFILTKSKIISVSEFK